MEKRESVSGEGEAGVGIKKIDEWGPHQVVGVEYEK
jgi:hypothetical protein